MMNWDYSLIKNWTPDTTERTNSVFPCLAEYKHRQKHLYYVAANHDYGLENPTCKLIKNTIHTTSPQLIIVEGLETDKGISPEGWSERAREAEQNGFVNSREPVYATALAIQNKIPFIGGEAAHKDIFEALNTKGYSDQDILAFYVLRAYVSTWKDRCLPENELENVANNYLETNSRFQHLPSERRINFQQFKQWFDRNNIGKKSYKEFDDYDIAPLAWASATPFQEISHAIGEVREQHLDALIATKLAEHDRVMVVYGNGHFSKSRKVFEHALGKPEYQYPHR